MSYHTWYELSILNADGTFDEEETISIIAQFRMSYAEAAYCLDTDGSVRCEGRWHNNENDLREFSKFFPDKVFILHGEGENNTDIWNKYFRAGKMQFCPAEITFKQYDERELR